MINPNIPKGCRLTVTTWENDADNYNTKILQGLTLEHARFLFALAKGFMRESDIANLFDPSEDEIAKVANFARQLFKEFPDKLNTEGLEDDDLADAIHDFMYDLGISGTDFYSRVVDKILVEYVPEDVYFDEVTELFRMFIK